MKLNLNKQMLLEGINIVMKAVSSRASQPILECILLSASDDELTLTGNDLEIGIECKPIKADVAEAGKTALSARIFSDIIRRFPGEEVTVQTTDNLVTLIKSAEYKSEFKLLGSAHDEFPALPLINAENSKNSDKDVNMGFEIFSDALRDLIRQTIFSVSVDESKAAMTGVLFEISEGILRVVSIDGFRISMRSASIDNKELSVYAIIPGRTLGEVMKILGGKGVVSVYFTDKHVLFETDEARIVSRLIEARMMDYQNVLESEPTTFIRVSTKEILDSIERAQLISREAKKSPVKFTFKGDSSLLIESNTEMGSFAEELPIEADGLDIKISFNPKFLTDILKVLDEETVEFMFTTPLSPCIIRGRGSNEEEAKGNHKYLVLPLRA